MAIIPFFKCSKILGEAGKPRNFTTNVPKILYLKSSSEQIFSENCRWVPLLNQTDFYRSKSFSYNFFVKSAAVVMSAKYDAMIGQYKAYIQFIQFIHRWSTLLSNYNRFWWRKLGFFFLLCFWATKALTLNVSCENYDSVKSWIIG